MKRKIFTLLFVISLILTTTDAIRLFMMQEKEPETTEGQLQYVFLAAMEEKFWLDVARGIKEADEKMGSETLLVHFKEWSNMETYIRDAALSGAKGIIAYGTDLSNDVIKETVSSGVPVLFFDADVPESGRTTFVGSDNVELGRMAARALIDEMGEEGEYLLITSRVDVYSQCKRIEGIEEVLKQYPSVSCTEIIEDCGNLMTLHTKLEETCNDRKPDGIISLEGMAADNLGELLQDFQIDQEDTAVIVTDLTDASIQFLENDDYDAVISLNASQIGYRAVEVLNQYYTRNRELQNTELIDGAIVTKDNLSEFVREKEDEELEWNSY